MNLASFPIFNYINLALSIVFAITLVVFKTSTEQLSLIILPLIVLGISIYNMTSGRGDSPKITNKYKITAMVTFIVAIFSAFSPYILQFSSNKSLFFSSLTFTILLFVSIFLANIKENE